MIQKIKIKIKQLEKCWMNPIIEEQRKYNKSRILEPNDGSDWRRELL